MLDYELETALDEELEAELELEALAEFEEDDSEQFAFLAPLLAKAAPFAISAISSLLRESELEGEFEDEFEEEFEDEFEEEFEDEFEWEFEDEAEAMAMMDQMADAAANSETEAEAEEFIGGLIRVGAKLLPRIAKKAVPVLFRGAKSLAKSFSRRGSKSLIRVIPAIIRATIRTIRKRARLGLPITSRWVLRVLEYNTRRFVTDPRLARRVIQLAYRRIRPYISRYSSYKRRRYPSYKRRRYPSYNRRRYPSYSSRRRTATAYR